MKQRILIVEDDAGMAKVLRDVLEFEGFIVAGAANGEVAVRQAKEFMPHLILLDVSLPGKSGFELCHALRSGRSTSIIFLTARSQKQDKLLGLGLGADDYVTKPFDIEELLARINAVLRRAKSKSGAQRLVVGRVMIDFESMQAWEDGQLIELTHRDFELLRYLLARRGSVVSRNELLGAVWGYPATLDTRAVDHAIVRLRRKIEPDAHHPRFIRTAHGDGYYLAIGPRQKAER